MVFALAEGVFFFSRQLRICPRQKTAIRYYYKILMEFIIFDSFETFEYFFCKTEAILLVFTIEISRYSQNRFKIQKKNLQQFQEVCDKSLFLCYQHIDKVLIIYLLKLWIYLFSHHFTWARERSEICCFHELQCFAILVSRYDQSIYNTTTHINR